MHQLEGKVALVTGAGRRGGIGAAVALRLAREGAHVAISDLCAAPMSGVASPGGGQWDELQALAADITALGVRALPLRADVTVRTEVETMMAETMKAFGRLNILVNNAGVALGPAPIAQMQEAAWRRTLEINATGVFLCCQVAIPALVQSGKSGRIINMSSLAAIRPKPYLSAYAASKAAVVALTQALAQEVAPFGITVNAILPGDIDTAFKQWGLQIESIVRGRPYDQVYAEAVAQIPVGRMGLPEDVASLVAYLAADEAGFITGQAYPLTGGRELVAAAMPR